LGLDVAVKMKFLCP